MRMGACKLTLFLCLVFVPACFGGILDFLFGPEEPTGRPAFCKSYQCPNFTVITTGEDYVLRRYEPTTWVATEKGNEWLSKMSMFRRLAKYTLRGYNNLGLRMPMTVPVLRKSSTRAPEEMMFMLPDDRQENPPMPTDPSVYIVRMPVIRVYVRSFGGYASDTDYNNEIQALKSSLNADGIRYNRNVAYKVGYDSPFTMFNRHNEVWLVAK